MTPIGIRHALCVDLLTRVFSRRFADRAVVRVQNPVRLEDVLLVVEVADTSLGRDRGRKLPLYAGAGIAEVWIVNVDARGIEVYRKPSSTRYTPVQCFREGTVTALAFPDESISVDEILGPPPSDHPA